MSESPPRPMVVGHPGGGTGPTGGGTGGTGPTDGGTGGTGPYGRGPGGPTGGGTGPHGKGGGSGPPTGPGGGGTGPGGRGPGGGRTGPGGPGGGGKGPGGGGKGPGGGGKGPGGGGSGPGGGGSGPGGFNWPWAGWTWPTIPTTPPWAGKIGPFPSPFTMATWIRSKFYLMMGSLDGWQYNSMSRGVIALTLDVTGATTALGKTGVVIVLTDLTSGASLTLPQPVDASQIDVNAYLNYMLSDSINISVGLTGINLAGPGGYALLDETVTGFEASAGLVLPVTIPDLAVGLNVTVSSGAAAIGDMVNVTVYDPNNLEVFGTIGSMLETTSQDLKGGATSAFTVNAPSLAFFAGDTYTVNATITTPNGNLNTATASVAGSGLDSVSLSVAIAPPVSGGLPVEVVEQTEFENISVNAPVGGALVNAVATDGNGNQLTASGTTPASGLVTLVFSSVDPTQTYSIVINASLGSLNGTITLPAVSGAVLEAGTDMTTQVQI